MIYEIIFIFGFLIGLEFQNLFIKQYKECLIPITTIIKILKQKKQKSWINMSLKKIVYGDRCKKYVMIDSGKIGECILSKDGTKTKIKGIIKSVNDKNIKEDVLYFDSNLAENLMIEYNNDKAEYYQNSKEFDTLLKNNILEKLMITQAEKLIQIITIIMIVVVILVLYEVFQLRGLGADVKGLAQIINDNIVSEVWIYGKG